MAKKEQEKELIIYCSAPGKKGATPFTRILADGTEVKFYVELNKSTNVTTRPWVYHQWLTSYWNEDRPLTPSLQKRQKNLIDGESSSGSMDAFFDK